MAASGPPENAELVLQAHDVHVADVEEVCRPQIGRKVLFLNFESNHLGVFIATLHVIDRNRETLALRMGCGDSSQQVGRKRGDAALAWQVIGDESNLPDLGIHEAFPFKGAELRKCKGSLKFCNSR